MAEIKRVDYTTKDYEGYREDMIELIPQKLPEWTDRSASDPGIVLLELLAYQLEKQSYYNDRVANEVFLPTATQRRSVINHCKRVGYELEWHTAARHWQVFEFVPQPEDILIPKGTLVGTTESDVEEAIIFETMEDLVIPAGMTGLEKDGGGEYIYRVEVEHGQTITDEYLGDVLTNAPYQEFNLMYSPILKNSIEVYVEEANGLFKWEMVADFISSIQDSMHFIPEMDEFERVSIQFGSGVSGRIPSAPAKVFANYKYGGGIEGNVGSGTITQFFEGIPGFVSTSNPYGPHVLGKDKESIEDAKWKAPASLKTLNRYVSLPDYETGIRIDYPSVAKAKAVNVDGAIELYLAPEDGGVLTSAQKAEVLEIIDEKKVIFTNVTVMDPTYVTVDVACTIYAYSNYDGNMIKYSAENTIREMFEPTNMDFGKEVTIAELHFKVMQSVEGVRNISITNPLDDVAITQTQIPKLGTVTIQVIGG